MKKLFVLSLVMLMTIGVFAQKAKITGKIVDAQSGEALIGATAGLSGYAIGSVADLTGNFKINNVPTGSYTLVISFVGYEDQSFEIEVKGGETKKMGTVELKSTAIGLDEIRIISSSAVDRQTPVAVSTISGDEIAKNIGTQELPEVLKTMPGVYATKKGGGTGDSRINIRGFNQRNIAVLINGIPVNDMENGWVYWSNWAGLAEATSTIQVQRGLGASRLAINSIGGTMNIITKTTDIEKSGSFTQSITDYGNSKSTLMLSSGKMENDMAITFVGSRTQGSGYIDQTWVDAWSYFLSVSKDFGDDHQLVFTAIGAPQQHGQRDRELTKDEIDTYGPKYNKDWGWLGGEAVNQRVNYYHKPQLALNHYWNVSEKSFLATSLYLSIGRGGGSGPLGDYASNSDPDGLLNWGNVYDNNVNNMDTVTFDNGAQYIPANGDPVSSQTILRNSVNRHFWYGALSTFKHDFSENLHLLAGLDARHYKGEHYREVRDLLGGDYWFEQYKYAVDGAGGRDQYKTVGEKIAYDNDGVVTYGGLFGQLEYASNKISTFVAATVSNTWFKRVDRYNYIDDIESDVATALGYNAKLGANYNISDKHNVFLNAGYYSKAPDFRFVFVNYSNTLSNEDLENEKIIGVEAGYGFSSAKFAMKLNVYHTMWNDKSLLSRRITTESGAQVNAFIKGQDAVHQGVELEFNSIITNNFNLGGFVSLGNWEWASDVTADVVDDATNEVYTTEIYADGLKVGDAPQTQIGIIGDYTIYKDWEIGVVFTYNDDYYANYDPEDRDDPNDRVQPYKLDPFALLDLRLAYSFKFTGLDAQAMINCHNVTDQEYWAEAYDSDDHVSEEGLSGFYGWGRTWNFAVKVNF